MADRGGRSAHSRQILGALGLAEDVIHYVVVMVLLVAAVVVLVRLAAEFALGDDEFAVRTTAAINGVLLVLIVIELMRTVVAHFDDAGLQLKPFLVIGIISSVRHILTAGAQASLGVEAGDTEFRQTEIVLGANAAVTLALVVALVLIWRSEGALVPAAPDEVAPAMGSGIEVVTPSSSSLASEGSAPLTG